MLRREAGEAIRYGGGYTEGPARLEEGMEFGYWVSTALRKSPGRCWMWDKDVSAEVGPGTQLTEESRRDHEVCSGFQQTLSPHCVLAVTKEPACEDT